MEIKKMWGFNGPGDDVSEISVIYDNGKPVLYAWGWDDIDDYFPMEKDIQFSETKEIAESMWDLLAPSDDNVAWVLNFIRRRRESTDKNTMKDWLDTLAKKYNVNEWVYRDIFYHTDNDDTDLNVQYRFVKMLEYAFKGWVALCCRSFPISAVKGVKWGDDAAELTLDSGESIIIYDRSEIKLISFLFGEHIDFGMNYPHVDRKAKDEKLRLNKDNQ